MIVIMWRFQRSGAECGGSLVAWSRQSGKKRVYVYACGTYVKKGSTICKNRLITPLLAADEAILTTIERDLLQPSVIQRSVDKVIAHYTKPTQDSSRRGELQKAVQRTNEEKHRLVNAITAGGDIPSLVAALKQCEERVHHLNEELDSLNVMRMPTTVNAQAIAEAVHERLTQLRRLLRENTPGARRVLATLLEGRFDFTPRKDGMREFYEFTASGTLQPVLQGIVEIPVTRIGVPNGNRTPVDRRKIGRNRSVKASEFWSRPADDGASSRSR